MLNNVASTSKDRAGDGNGLRLTKPLVLRFLITLLR